MSDLVPPRNYDVTYFSETNANNRGYSRISNYFEGWTDTAGHGLTICYMEESVKILEKFYLPTVIEASSVSVEVYGEKILLVLVYRPPRQEVSTLIDGMISTFRDMWKGEWINLLGDFSSDEMLQENISRLVPLKEIFYLQQRSRHSTHQLGGILDLVLIQKSVNIFNGFCLPIAATLSFVFNFRSFKGINRK